MEERGSLDWIDIERLGGLAGFGTGGHLRSRGRVALTSLSPSDRGRIKRLFASGGDDGHVGGDQFRYRLTLAGKTVEVGGDDLPRLLLESLRDELI